MITSHIVVVVAAVAPVFGPTSIEIAVVIVLFRIPITGALYRLVIVVVLTREMRLSFKQSRSQSLDFRLVFLVSMDT